MAVQSQLFPMWQIESGCSQDAIRLCEKRVAVKLSAYVRR